MLNNNEKAIIREILEQPLPYLSNKDFANVIIDNEFIEKIKFYKIYLQDEYDIQESLLDRILNNKLAPIKLSNKNYAISLFSRNPTMDLKWQITKKEFKENILQFTLPFKTLWGFIFLLNRDIITEQIIKDYANSLEQIVISEIYE